ncbi:MAG TPA: NTP transferase domain-containing protein, partial [Pseudonocardiaceae bacterium]|nr:NTP transferase domain-containing protein [Pseudonocardiaceae bacterium]
MPDGGTQPNPVSTIILAAGEGTRMRSAIPKVLHRIAGRTLVDHAVRAVAGIDPDHLVVVVGHGREQVTEHLVEVTKNVGRPVTVAYQEKQRGTGHAVSCALNELPVELAGTVLVSYGDVPLLTTNTLRTLLAAHADGGYGATVLTSVVTDPTGYGRIIRDAAGLVTGIVEQADATAAQRA